MAHFDRVDSTQELLDAQSHVLNHTFIFINSMCLRCAIQLGIPDVIHKHGKPMTLSELANALSINTPKSDALHRLMRILVHSKFFDLSKGEEEAYCLTPASRLLLRDEPTSMAPFALVCTDPMFVDVFQNTSEWFLKEDSTTFVTNHGRVPGEFARGDHTWNRMFNDSLDRDARFVTSFPLKEWMHVFEGMESMVEVAGGAGTVAKAVADAFPGMKCTVFDLPRVVDGLHGSENLSYISGDMFKFIPCGDVIFLKWLLHDWDDEDCVKLLENCKEAITPSKNNGGKVVIIDMAVGDDKENHEATETQLLLDVLLMSFNSGKERTEQEWAKLFYTAGFASYKINSVLGLRSVIEVFP